MDEFDLDWEFSQILFFSEGFEGIFFCDVPLDGGVGAGGAYGLYLLLAYIDESFLFLDHLTFCLAVSFGCGKWFFRPV